MKRFFIALAAMAAMVGCQSVDEPIAIVDNNATLTLSASIVTDDTRVTVGGENFTEVSWEQGDVIRLESMAGMNVKLAATAAGKSNIRFEGEGVAVAEVDTYYAVYPDTNVSNGMVTFNYGEQSGDDVAAALVAMTKDSSMSGLQMEFRPVNALLHVAVSGVESLEKAEFMSFTGAKINSTFTYDFDTDAITYSLPVASLVVEGPAVEGFFFRLPADLDMSAGYIVRLTDASGNVCTKAYNGKVFERGTTTRVDIEWSQPTVTLGEPMTSYSYYAVGQASTANGCANNVIYFPNVSSYANVQNAMVAEAGVIVDGTPYTATIDTTTKSFTVSNVTVTSWGAKSVEAYVKTKDGETYKSAAQTVYITGLPYSYNFVDGSLDTYRSAGWSTNGSLRVSKESLVGRANTLVLNHRRYSEGLFWGIGAFDEHEKGFVVSPKFVIPATTLVQPSIVHSTYNAGGDLSRTTYVGAVSNTTSSNKSSVSFSTSAGNSIGGTVYGANEWQNAVGLTSATPYISIDCDDITSNNLGAYYFLHEAHFRYAE